ncbi:MAG: hypothetical protein ACOCUP_00190 [bacterium]
MFLIFTNLLVYGQEDSLSITNRVFELGEVSIISQTYSYSDGSYPVDAYGLTSLNFNAELPENFLVRFSVDNLFDLNYYYSEGYPARGKTFNFGLLFTFTR